MNRPGTRGSEKDCIWCSGPESTTEEDVIAQWIARAFSAGPPGLNDAAMTLWPPEARMVPAATQTFAWPPSAAVSGDAEFEAVADPDDELMRAWMP